MRQVFLSFGLILFLTSPAYAISEYSANVFASLFALQNGEFLDAAGSTGDPITLIRSQVSPFIGGNPNPDLFGITATGNATATASPGLFTGLSGGFHAFFGLTTGQAELVGHAESFSLGLYSLSLMNITDEIQPYEIRLFHNHVMSGSRTNPAFESAFAGVSVLLTDARGNTLRSFTDTVQAVNAFDVGSPTFQQDFTGLSLRPGEEITYNLRLEARGKAEAVPEPSTMLLLGSGLMGLFWWKRTRTG